MAQPGQMGFGARMTTTLTGGGRSVVGNISIAFCVSVIAGGVFGGSFLIAGAAPGFALSAFGATAAFFLVYMLVVLNHAANHPDSAVTSEEYYARVVETRVGAKDPSIIREAIAVSGASVEIANSIAALPEGMQQMSRFVHINFSFAGVPRILDLEPVFSAFGDWVRYSNTGWILFTSASLAEIYDAMERQINPDDNFLVVEIYQTAIAGRLPKWIWNWVNSKVPNSITISDSPARIEFKAPPSSRTKR